MSAETCLLKARSSTSRLTDETLGSSSVSPSLTVRKGDLVNVDRQRRQEAFKFDPSIQYAVEWLEKNPGELEGEVSLPPIISVNVPRKDFAWQVEACTSVAQRKVEDLVSHLTTDFHLPKPKRLRNSDEAQQETSCRRRPSSEGCAKPGNYRSHGRDCQSPTPLHRRTVASARL